MLLLLAYNHVLNNYWDKIADVVAMLLQVVGRLLLLTSPNACLVV